MPIEFRCPNCSKLLRTPDDSVGKKAKCPQCERVVDVPAESDRERTDTAGDRSGDVAASFGGDAGNPFAEGPSSSPGGYAVDEGNPYATPATGQARMKHTLPDDAASRSGLPWERSGKSFGTFWQTCKMVVGSPGEAFRVMYRDAGLGDPIFYALAGGIVGALITAAYNSIMQVVMFGALGMRQGGPDLGGLMAVQIVTQFLFALVAGTVGLLIALFVSAGIYHLMLMMLGGANHGFETTLRVVGYVTGTLALMQVIPFCGQYIYFIAGLVYTIIGLSVAQQVSGGKASAAVLLPLLLCGLACGGLIFGMFAMSV